MTNIPGRLLLSDEGLNHQIAETFATVSQSDLAWTEKVWGCFSLLDGSLQVDTGLGKYQNRNVMDAFAGVSRGTEQWTVRSSRELSGDPETSSVGPITYEVLEPLRVVRFSLAPNDSAPIAFEITFTAALPPFLEHRDHKRELGGFRVWSDTLRYHQMGRAAGWVEVDGRRVNLAPETTIAVRDHSWGVRMSVGAPPPDLRPGPDPATLPILMQWSPILFEAPDGGHYEIHHYLQALGDHVYYQSAHVNSADGSQRPIRNVRTALEFDPGTRRLRGGKIYLELDDDERRTLEVAVVGQTGFHLGAGLYIGLDGKHHGMWRGPLHVEGDHVVDCTDPATVRRIHQLRDCIIMVHDGDAVGYGVIETLLGGAWPNLGLEAEGAFL